MLVGLDGKSNIGMYGGFEGVVEFRGFGQFRGGHNDNVVDTCVAQRADSVTE